MTRMKTNLLPALPHLALVLCTLAAATFAPAAERVGVYDSRVVAYAHFWRPDRQAELSRQMAEGRAAKERGDTARFRELEKQIKATQEALHLQVFSTAPIPDVMARLRDQIPAIAREAGVQRLVSIWDEEALREVAEANRVDVTDLLVRDIPLNQKQLEIMKQIRKKKPVPLAKARTEGAMKH